MDMRALFEDFKRHIETLDDEAIRQSIARAVDCSRNSVFLECVDEKENSEYTQSNMQLLQCSYNTNGFTFCSVDFNSGENSYVINDLGGVAA